MIYRYTMSETLSILVVDDYPPLVSILAKILDLNGFEVQTANSGAEALDILQAHPVDVLLTDVMMPDMNGIELYRETKKTHPSITAILMTAYAPEDLIQQGFEEGIKTILDKPLNMDYLVALFSIIKASKSNSG